MKMQTEGHGWQDLSQKDRNFFYEMGVSAIAAAAIVLLFG
jgi:hypothetical protein